MKLNRYALRRLIMEEADGTAGGGAAGAAAISAGAKKAADATSDGTGNIYKTVKDLQELMSDPNEYKPGDDKNGMHYRIATRLFIAAKGLDGVSLDEPTKSRAIQQLKSAKPGNVVDVLKTFISGLKDSGAKEASDALSMYIEKLEKGKGKGKKKKSGGWSSQPPEMKQKWQELVKIDKDIASKFGSKGSYREWQRWYMTSTKDKEAWEALGKPKRKYLNKKETLDLLDILIKSNKGTLEERLMRKWFNVL